MRSQAEPASRAEIVTVLTGLRAVYGTPEEWDLAIGIYVDHLQYPRAVLQPAAERYIRTGKWFPKPAELIEVCEELMIPIRDRVRAAEGNLAFVKLEDYRTVEEDAALRKQLYGPRRPGDWAGSLGSSAVRATDLAPDRWMPSPEALKELENWQTIPIPE